MHAAVLLAGDPRQRRCEHALVERGVPLPLQHRLVWSGVDGSTATWFVAVHTTDGQCRYGFGVQVFRSRALPGHLLLRVQGLDPSVDFDGCVVALRALADSARRRWPRVLRVSVELFSLDGEARSRLASRLGEIGFRRQNRMRMYRHTPILDIAGDLESIFERLPRKTRRNIRAVEKSGATVRPIEDPGLAPRVDALARETFARTGGRYRAERWGAIIDLSRREPRLSRIAGLFLRDGNSESLLAFDWACMQGDHSQHIAAGSTRSAGNRIPLGYAPQWELICWAHQQGARYVDLGGITEGGVDSEDPLGGISDFKRSFDPEIVEVGDEWVLEPNRIAARLASAVARGAALLRRSASLLRPAKSASFTRREG